MKIKIFNEFNQELKNLWVNFEVDAYSTAFQSYEWQKYWNEKIGQPKYQIKIYILVCMDEHKLRAIFPFGVHKAMGSRVLSFLGLESADYNSPLLACGMQSKEFKDIWIMVLKALPKHDVIYFRNIPREIQNSDNMLLENMKCKADELAYSTSLPESMHEYLPRLSKKMLKDNARMMKKLSEKGNLKFLVINDPKEFTIFSNTMISQKEKRYLITGNRNIFEDLAIKDFYQNIFQLYNRGFKIHLSILMLDDVPLATHLGICYKKEFYYLMPTFNPDQKWKKFSLGRLHLQNLINWSIDNGYQKFDFTIGAEAYKNTWCDSQMIIYSHLKLKTYRGVIYFIYRVMFKYIRSHLRLKNLVLIMLKGRKKFKIKL